MRNLSILNKSLNNLNSPVTPLKMSKLYSASSTIKGSKEWTETEIDGK